MLEKEKDLLQNEYLKCLEIAKHDKYMTSLTKEKIQHSYQVLEAGNFLLKEENVFKNWSSQRIKEARTALLLHDIGRFAEITSKIQFPEQSTDHGILGYNILANIPEYYNPRIIIPIKHHGHMIEELYNDPEYYTLEDPQLKYEIEKITFLVRDADKIANFKLLSESGQDIWTLFNIKKNTSQKMPVSQEALNTFLKQEVIRFPDVHTNSDSILFLICWIFDLNYNSSFAYMQNNQCFEFLVEELRNSNSDSSTQHQIEQIIQNYLHQKNINSGGKL